jgi:hypothetical protein
VSDQNKHETQVGSTSELLPVMLLAIRCCLERGSVHPPYVCQFLVDPLLLELAGASIPQVSDKRHKSCAGCVSQRPGVAAWSGAYLAS